MTTLKQIRSFYVHATAWDFDGDVQPHIEKMRRIQAEEFDSLLMEVRANAWDEGWNNRAGYDATPDVDEPEACNPYRKGN